MTLYYTKNDQNTVAYNKIDGCEDNRPGIIFLGGFRSDKEGTKALFLEEQCRKDKLSYIRFDYFAHGQSSGDFSHGTISRWKEDCLDILDHIADPQRKYILIGSSMGGWLMLLTALARKERIHSLLGLAPAPDFTEDLIYNVMSDHQKQALETNGYIEEPNQYSDKPYLITQKLIEDGRKNLLLSRPLSLEIPISLIHGKQDNDVPFEWSQKIKSLLPQAHIHFIEDGDHRLSRPQDLTLLWATLQRLILL